MVNQVTTKIRDRESDDEDSFEFWLQRCPEPMRMALIDVADTAFMCMRWLASNGTPHYTAADVMAMTKMVMDRETALANDKSKPTDGGEDWKRRGLSPEFMITPTGHVIRINEWPGLDEWMARHLKKDSARAK